MGQGVGFEGANVVFQAPKGATDCVDLQVCMNSEQIISCWRLSKAELEEVAKTGVVWVSIQGQGMPPIYISGEALMTVGDRPAKAEPVLPTRPIKDRGAAT